MKEREFYWNIGGSFELKRFKRTIGELDRLLHSVYMRICELRWRRLILISQRKSARNLKLLAAISDEFMCLEGTSNLGGTIASIKSMIVLGKIISEKCETDNVESSAEVIVAYLDHFICKLDNIQEYFEYCPLVSIYGIRDRVLDLKGFIERAMEPDVFYGFKPPEAGRSAVRHGPP